MRSVKRIIKIHKIEGYKINCLFSNGESRIIDFEQVFKQWKIGEDAIEYLLTPSVTEFQKVKILDGTFVWENIEIEY